MPDAGGAFKGISVPSVPWHDNGEVDDDTRASWRIEDDQLALDAKSATTTKTAQAQ